MKYLYYYLHLSSAVVYTCITIECDFLKQQRRRRTLATSQHPQSTVLNTAYALLIKYMCTEARRLATERNTIIQPDSEYA